MSLRVAPPEVEAVIRWFLCADVPVGPARAAFPELNFPHRHGQRFKQSGMIWSLDGSKALLAIRTLYKSNRFEEFFNHLVARLPQVACAA